MGSKESHPMARRRFIEATAATVGIAGCSDIIGQNDPETVESKDTEYDLISNSNDDAENTSTPEKKWDNQDNIDRYKSKSNSWIEIPVVNIDHLDYYAPEVEQYAQLDDKGQTDNVIGNANGEIKADLSQDGVEHLRRYVANNIFEGNRESSVSVILRYDKEHCSLAEKENEELAWIFGIPVIPSRFPELNYYGEVDNVNYPSDNMIEGHLFNESAIEKFFQDHVSGVKDSSRDFPKELLEYAER